LIFTSRQGSCAIEKAGLIEKQRNQYEQLERQTEKLSALGGMVAGIAHEINNPLAGILLYSSNMAKKIPEGDPIKEGLEIVISETKRCKAIIQDLLEFSRAGQPETSRCNINDIIEKVLFILSNEFGLHHIIVEKHLSSEMVDLRLDEKQIQQVFVNVLLNAIHAIEDRGTIAVRSHLFLDQEVVRVEITDSGCGIPENELTKIFEPFFSTKKNGTGLGLSVSYGIIRKHGGDIYALSQPDKGSSFIITLPLSNQVGKTA
jgi:signal transduction histidine kinase